MCVPASLDQVFEAQALEVMTRACADADGALIPGALEAISEATKRADALAVGPGITMSAALCRWSSECVSGQGFGSPGHPDSPSPHQGSSSASR